jgi:ATP-dependent RNA helicase HelY
MNGRPPEIPPHKLISALRNYNLLPAIVFMPTRRKCDESASEVAADKSRPRDPAKFAKRQAMFDEFGFENPEIYRHKHAKILVNAGVAAHHAGHMPSWKLLIEKMMSAGFLNAIFATSTVAAGVDFPARTVVISNADTRGNEGWRPFTANELQQMTGRAGRRGKDNVGFVVLAPGQFQKPHVIAELLKAKPDALQSKFRATYTSLLNLLDAFGSFKHVRDIAERSFAFREQKRRGDIWRPFANRAKVLDHFGYLDYETQKVTASGKWLADLRVDRPLLVGEAIKHGLLDDIHPKAAAGLMASIASDPDRDYGSLNLSDPLMDAVASIEDIIYEVSRVEWKFGVDPVEEINLSAAAAAERWAGGMSWSELAKRTRADEGDLVRLLSRTGEALMQIAHLKGSNIKAAALARETSELILREPVR